MFPTVGSLGLLCTFSALPSRILPVTLRGAVGHVIGHSGVSRSVSPRPRAFLPSCSLSVRPRVFREAVRCTLCSRSDRFRKVWCLTPTVQKCQVLLPFSGSCILLARAPLTTVSLPLPGYRGMAVWSLVVEMRGLVSSAARQVVRRGR